MIYHVSDAEKRWTALRIDRETYARLYADMHNAFNTGSVYAAHGFDYPALRAQDTPTNRWMAGCVYNGRILRIGRP